MTPHALLADAAFLISFYKPIIMLATIVPWAWYVSSRLDKDAQFFKQPREQWNAVYMGCLAAALALMLFVPIFWVGWPVGAVVLVAPVFAYVRIRNSRVDEKDQIRFTSEGLRDKLSRAKQARADKAATVHFYSQDGEEHPAPTKEDPRHGVHLALEDVVVPALEARASKVELAVGPQGSVVTQTIDGIRYKRDPIEGEEAVAVIDYIKGLAGLSVEDRRRRQQADFRMDGPMGRTMLSLVTAGSSSGQELRLFFDRGKQVRKPIDGLGLLPQQLAQLRELEQAEQRHGVFLFGAPRGHGLTTTGYALIGRHDAYTSNIKTLEREVEGRLDGVDHTRWDPTNPDIDYPTNLQSILRRDPDIVLVAELQDADTARVIADHGQEGPIIYVPQRADSINTQIREWVKLVGDVKTAVRSLTGVLNQRLLRVVCPNCRQAYQPSAEQLSRLNLPADKIGQLYQASGKIQVKNKIETCPVCGGSGYFGQTAIFQYMPIGTETRQLLAGGDLKGALAQARRNKMLYLQEVALRKVVEGQTTIDEVVRVTSPPRPAAAKPAKPEPDPAPAG